MVPLFCVILGLVGAQNFTQKVFYYNQTIDHFHIPVQEAGVFSQRYYVIDDYWNVASGPIFLYLCGESECKGVTSTTKSLFPLQVAKENAARYISLEHRYYGVSIPINNTGLFQQIFQYHDVDQALADIAQFIRYMNFQMQEIRKTTIPPKWVVIGGSYAGALSAWFRTRYPNLATAAWASSAVVRPILDFSDFDKQVYISTAKSGQNCVDSIKSVNNLIQSQYIAGNMTVITDLFNATSVFSNDPDQITVLWYIADTMAEMVQYGKRVELCQALNSASSPWDKLKQVSIVGNTYGLANPNAYAVSALKNLNIAQNVMDRQWWWQQCQQFGWLQTPSEYQMRPSYLNMTFWNWYCQQIYSYPGGITLPNTNITAAGLSYKANNIVYTNGSEDPWQWASNNAVSTEARPILKIECDFCGHCIDFKTPNSTDPASLTRARTYIKAYIAQWLRS
ncbi:unnamed protein product [Blepharisma stoltei]|uniref:Serine carboxypeptidase S28 family protein n=1 Tax=Blepharisma stoltei TaxID=1481888 RepID=A0AAU9K7J6_9CILI|nr:unnamed protein product [Blepharisma stoltei]